MNSRHLLHPFAGFRPLTLLGALLLLATTALAGYPRFIRRQALPQPAGAEECGIQIKGMGTDTAGNLYVADGGWNRVLKLNAAGQVLLEFGSYGTTAGKFERLEDVAADSAGNIYTTDTARHMVTKFDSAGNFVREWGGLGTETGQFNRPTHIYCHTDGRIFVADTLNGRVQAFNTNGQLLSVLNLPADTNGQPVLLTCFSLYGDIMILMGSDRFVSQWSTNTPHMRISNALPFSVSGYTRPARQLEVLDDRALVVTSDAIEMGLYVPAGSSTGTIPVFAQNDGSSYREALAVLPGRLCYVSNSNWCSLDVYQFDAPLNAPDPAWVFELPSQFTAVTGLPFEIRAEVTGSSPLTFEWGHTLVTGPPHFTSYFEQVQPGYDSPVFRIASVGAGATPYTVYIRSPFGWLTKNFTVTGVTSTEPFVIKTAVMNSTRTLMQITTGRPVNPTPLTTTELGALILQRSTDLQNWVNESVSAQAHANGAIFTVPVNPSANGRVYWRVKY